MATIKSFTSLEQSKKLAEILPIESADMCYGINDDTLKYNNLPWLIPYHKYTAKKFYVPCWSLAALLEAMPKIHGLKPILDLEECSIQYSGIDLYITASNPIDVCVEMIIHLHKLNLL